MYFWVYMPFMARRYATTMSPPKVEQEQRY